MFVSCLATEDRWPTWAGSFRLPQGERGGGRHPENSGKAHFSLKYVRSGWLLSSSTDLRLGRWDRKIDVTKPPLLDSPLSPANRLLPFCVTLYPPLAGRPAQVPHLRPRPCLGKQGPSPGPSVALDRRGGSRELRAMNAKRHSDLEDALRGPSGHSQDGPRPVPATTPQCAHHPAAARVLDA